MKFESLEKELTRALLHAFMFDKIVNKENIVDPVSDSRCRFSKQEFNNWFQHYPEIQNLYTTIIDMNNQNDLQMALRATC